MVMLCTRCYGSGVERLAVRRRVSIDRLVRISLLVRISREIRVGRAFQEERTVFFGQNVQDEEESETYFAKEILRMNCLAFHIT